MIRQSHCAEIGSEFWDVPQVETCHEMFPKATQWYLSGRSALMAILAELEGCRTVAMPSWCCDSMIKPFADAGLEVRFYRIDWKSGLTRELCTDCDILFLMEYFGYSGTPFERNGYRGVVIRDVTHSLFSGTYSDADYYFGSLRKWCGIWTGGYAWRADGRAMRSVVTADDGGYTALRKKAMQLKHAYINGVDALGADKSYLGVFSEAEDILEDIGILAAAERDVEAALHLDVAYIKKRRRANAEILRKAFHDWLIFPEMAATDCPMFVPVLVPEGKRDALRRNLIEHQIYCPIHWPVSNYHSVDVKNDMIYANELSLVCDQRYTEEDMNRMVDTIRTFWKEG